MNKDAPEGNVSSDAWKALGIRDEATARFALRQLVSVGLRILGADQGSLLVAEPERRILRFAMVVSSGRFAGTAPDLEGKIVPIGEGITGMAALTHDVQSASDADGAEFHRIRGDGSPHAVLAAPMLLGESLLGVITAVSFDRRKSFSAEQTQTYGMLAGLAATVVDQQRRLDGTAAGEAPSPTEMRADEREEWQLVADLLSFVRAKEGRTAAVRALLSDLARMP